MAVLVHRQLHLPAMYSELYGIGGVEGSTLQKMDITLVVTLRKSAIGHEGWWRQSGNLVDVAPNTTNYPHSDSIDCLRVEILNDAFAIWLPLDFLKHLLAFSLHPDAKFNFVLSFLVR